MITVFQQSFSLALPDKREILRYAGVRGLSEEIERLLEECINETLPLFSGKVCWCEIPINKAIELQGIDKMLDSRALSSHIQDCRKIILFAATVGIDIDRAIARYTALSPSKALLASSVGNERIESLCDEFEKYIKNESKDITSRFSPGYADLSIDFQKDIFSILECHKRIGLTLNESLIMSPSKSVSAIIGVK